MTYINPEDVRIVGTQFTYNAIDDENLRKLIERASRFFDLECGVAPGYFESVDTATPQTFYGNGGQYLRLPPYVPGSITSVTVPTGYTTLEYVEQHGYLVRKTSEGVLASEYVHPGGWYSGVPITVTAKWGFLATPQDVQNAIIELVINLFRETDPASLKITNLEGQPLREKLPPRVARIARHYQLKGAEFV